MSNRVFDVYGEFDEVGDHARAIYHKLLEEQWDGVFLAGGALRAAYGREAERNDIDLFVENEELFDDLRAFFGSRGATERYEADGVVRLDYNGWEIDLVRFVFPDSAINCIDMFDFTVCCAATDGVNFYVHHRFFVDLAARSLVVHRITWPYSTLRRFQKYVGKGFKACNGSLREILDGLRATPDDAIDLDVLYVD